MSRVKGSPKTGGRKKGTPNKKTPDLQARIAEKFPGFCPVEHMCAYVLDESEPAKDRAVIAKEVAPYIYAKRKAVEITGAGNGPIDLSVQVSFVAANTKTKKK